MYTVKRYVQRYLLEILDLFSLLFIVAAGLFGAPWWIVLLGLAWWFKHESD